MGSSLSVEEDPILIPPKVDERPENVSSPSSTEKVQLWPIFTWKARRTDGLQLGPSKPYGRVPDQYKDVDRTIREILEECDGNALWSAEYEGELAAVLHIRSSDRMNLAAEMERIDVIMQLEESDQHTEKGKTWALKQKVISSALGILNAFVPVHYQDINEYWLIQKFYGALMRITAEDVRHYTV
jgi:hypothetical protein